jgi:hypothetical protein
MAFSRDDRLAEQIMSTRPHCNQTVLTSRFTADPRARNGHHKALRPTRPSESADDRPRRALPDPESRELLGVQFHLYYAMQG